MSKLNKSSTPTDPCERGLEDFKWALGLNQLSLRIMGVWPGDDDIEGIAGLGVLLRVPIMVMFMFFFLFLPQMYALALVIKELPLVIDNLMTSCAALTSCIKLFFIWHNKKGTNFYHQVLRIVIQSVTRDWLRFKQDWELTAMKREATRARIFTISGYVVLGSAYAGFAFAPLFGLNIRMITNITDYGDKYLLVQSYFPYDYSKSPYYEITHISQLIAGFFVGMSVSIPDNYFAALVFHTSAQFEILGAHIEHFIREDKKAFRGRNFNWKLGVFVKRHVHLITIITAVENSFTFVVMAQLFCMSVMVCCLGFQILGMFDNTGTTEKPSHLQILTLLSTLFSLMTHTLVDCFASETLAMRSGSIFYSVYKSKWYTVTDQSTRDIIPLMIASMIPRQLTAGKIFYLSLATYCNILKSVAGYISMLIAVNSR